MKHLLEMRPGKAEVPSQVPQESGPVARKLPHLAQRVKQFLVKEMWCCVLYFGGGQRIHGRVHLAGPAFN